MRLLLTHRRNLKRKFLDIENAIRHSLKAFGIKLGGTSRGAFDQAVRTAVTDDPLSAELMDAMLSARAALWREYCRLHDLVVKIVAKSELCRRFMAIPGVGPVTALSVGDCDHVWLKRGDNVIRNHRFQHALRKCDLEVWETAQRSWSAGQGAISRSARWAKVKTLSRL